MDPRTRGKGKEKASSNQYDNPFIEYRPPAGETEEGRIRRVKASQDALRISREIDESLQETKKQLDRRRRGLRLLLLGQAEAGKSTVLKNFQMAFTPAQFQREKVIWKIIIQLNLIHAAKLILDVLSNRETPNSPSDSDSTLPPSPTTPSSTIDRKFRRLHLTLSPLLSVEATAIKILSLSSRSSCNNICVQAGTSWKSRLGFHDTNRLSTDSGRMGSSEEAILSDLTRLLEVSSEELASLWEDEENRSILTSRGVRIDNHPGFFFLHEVARIASPGYVPTDSERHRPSEVRTIGVEEHHLICETEAQKGSEFFITDVGGARSLRSSWIPFFDDAQAILFLAPLAFDQMLDEDRKVNRLEDSIMLWRGICSNVLLADCVFIIFFNKKDILQHTLESGIPVKKFVPSYDGLNDVFHVTKYFKDRFKAAFKKLSPKPRPFISYETSAIDTRAMKALILIVHDGIVRNNLANSDMI